MEVFGDRLSSRVLFSPCDDCFLPLFRARFEVGSCAFNSHPHVICLAIRAARPLPRVFVLGLPSRFRL